MLIASALACPASGATLEQKQSAAKDRIQQTTAAIEAGRAGLESARKKADAAAARESGLNGLLINGEQRSTELAGKLEDAEAALSRSKKRLARARRLLAQRLIAIYVSGEMPSTLDMALGASSFSELATGTTYIKSIEDSDTTLATRVAQLRHQLSGRVDGIGEAKDAIDQHNAELSSARDQIASVRAEAESSAASLASANAERADQIDALKGDIAGWQKQIEKRQKVSQAQAEQTVEEDLGGPYSIPTYIVMCESGGNYSAVNSSSGAGGAYQIMPSTWAAYGGQGLPQDASKAEQDRIAAQIWADSGPGAWSCA